MGFLNPILAGTTLIREAIKSPNYVAGVSGWSINKDGVDLRGTLIVADGSGAFVELNIIPGIGPAVGLNPPNVVGINYNPGLMYAQQVPAAFSQPQTVLQSPYNTVVATPTLPSSITLAAESVPAAGDDFIEINATRTNIDGLLRILGELIDPNAFHDTGTSPQTFIGTTMQDVSGLDNITIPAGARYTYELHIAYDAAAATDAKFAWTSSGVVGTTVPIDRCILAPTLGAASNINTAMQSIRRAISTQQQVGGCAGVANAFTMYHEWGNILNADLVNAQTITFQAAEVVAGAGVTVQGSSWLRMARRQ